MLRCKSPSGSVRQRTKACCMSMIHCAAIRCARPCPGRRQSEGAESLEKPSGADRRAPDERSSLVTNRAPARTPHTMPDLSTRLLSHWRRLRKQPRRFALYAAAAAATTLLLRLSSRNKSMVRAVRLAPVSELLQAVEKGKVEAAWLSIGACVFRLVGGENCKALLLPNDAKLLTKMLHRHAVPYAAQGPPAWRQALVLLVPFAYLGVCGWLLHRMTNDLHGGGPDGNAGGGGAAGSAEGDDESNAALMVGWDDVAGLPGIKSAVMEVVDVMHRPQHYARLGGNAMPEPRCLCSGLPSPPLSTALAHFSFRLVSRESCSSLPTWSAARGASRNRQDDACTRGSERSRRAVPLLHGFRLR